MSGIVARAGEMPGAGRLFGAALVASLLAGMAGLLIVFGRGLFELTGLIPVGLIYALVPGVPSLLLLRCFAGGSETHPGREAAVFALVGAAAGVLWFVPFMGIFVPSDATLASGAVLGMAGCHALAGALGGLTFWLLAGRGRDR